MAQATWKREQRPPLAPKMLRMIREAGLYLLVAIAVYLLISLWTYHAADPGWSHSGDSSRVENLGGRAGAWLASLEFEVAGARPAAVLRAPGRKPVWLYRAPLA